MTDANKLIKLGNTLMEIDRDRNNRKYLIFLFENTKKLNADLKKLTREY